MFTIKLEVLEKDISYLKVLFEEGELSKLLDRKVIGFNIIEHNVHRFDSSEDQDNKKVLSAEFNQEHSISNKFRSILKTPYTFKKIVLYWDENYSTNPIEIFLKDVIDFFEDNEIVENSIRELHRYSQLNELQRKGIISSKDYVQKLSEISSNSFKILENIKEYYLPILPLEVLPSQTMGSQFIIEQQIIEDWKYLPNKAAKNKIGIRVLGGTLAPIYNDEDILICKKISLSNVSMLHNLIIIDKDDNIYIGKYIKNENNKIELVSISNESDQFQFSTMDIKEIWDVESITSYNKA